MRHKFYVALWEYSNPRKRVSLIPSLSFTTLRHICKVSVLWAIGWGNVIMLFDIILAYRLDAV